MEASFSQIKYQIMNFNGTGEFLKQYDVSYVLFMYSLC